MRPIDLKDIIAGLLTVIAFATAWGQYGNLEKFARREFAKSLTPQGWYSAPFFRTSEPSKVRHKCVPSQHRGVKCKKI